MFDGINFGIADKHFATIGGAIRTKFRKGSKVKTPYGSGKVWLMDKDDIVCVELTAEPGVVYEFDLVEISAEEKPQKKISANKKVAQPGPSYTEQSFKIIPGVNLGGDIFRYDHYAGGETGKATCVGGSCPVCDTTKSK